MVFYSLGEKKPLVLQLKVVQNILQLGPLLSDINNYTLRVTLYGSAAKGENTEDSDTDLFILTRHKVEIEKTLYVDRFMFKNQQ